MKAADGTEIPKGSRLVGHVTEVQAHAKGQPESRMGLQFDRVELKNGQSFPIHSILQSVQPNPEAVAAASMANDDAFSSPAGAGAMSAGSSANMRGGGPVGGVTSAPGRVGPDIGSTTGGAVDTSRDLGADSAGDLNRGIGGVAGATTGAVSDAGRVAGATSLGTRSTGISGVMLHTDASGAASGMLSASNQNIHLDSGTQIVVGIAAAR